MINIFTDGSSLGNPGAGGWGAIVQDNGFVKELGGAEDKTTNNRMEMMAIIESIRSIGTDQDSITVHTDSKYTIDGITKWVFGWQKNGWMTKNKTEVLNRDLWEKLVEVVKNKNIEWKHVSGHVGIPGNERVDDIAVAFSSGKGTNLYEGSKENYTVDLSITESNEPKKKNKAKAYSYVSLVDGEIETHKTWFECESRVNGKKARFKKVVSKEEEDSLVKEWST